MVPRGPGRLLSALSRPLAAVSWATRSHPGPGRLGPWGCSPVPGCRGVRSAAWSAAAAPGPPAPAPCVSCARRSVVRAFRWSGGLSDGRRLVTGRGVRSAPVSGGRLRRARCPIAVSGGRPGLVTGRPSGARPAGLRLAGGRLRVCPAARGSVRCVIPASVSRGRSCIGPARWPQVPCQPVPGPVGSCRRTWSRAGAVSAATAYHRPACRRRGPSAPRPAGGQGGRAGRAGGRSAGGVSAGTLACAGSPAAARIGRCGPGEVFGRLLGSGRGVVLLGGPGRTGPGGRSALPGRDGADDCAGRVHGAGLGRGVRPLAGCEAAGRGRAVPGCPARSGCGRGSGQRGSGLRSPGEAAPARALLPGPGWCAVPAGAVSAAAPSAPAAPAGRGRPGAAELPQHRQQQAERQQQEDPGEDGDGRGGRFAGDVRRRSRAPRRRRPPRPAAPAWSARRRCACHQLAPRAATAPRRRTPPASRRRSTGKIRAMLGDTPADSAIL